MSVLGDVITAHSGALMLAACVALVLLGALLLWAAEAQP